MKNKRKTKVLSDILLAFVLITPVIILYLCHYLVFWVHPGLIPTGFIQLDQAFYMASAREYWDQGNFNILFSNPADPALQSPAIYFQLPVLILSVLWKITAADPGLLLTLFGITSGWACFYVCIRFWREYTGHWESYDKAGLLLFAWGGGLLFMGGLCWSFLKGHPGKDVFVFDPTQGWWFLNWGRNLVLPLEAFYHLLFICMVRSIYNRRYKLSLLFPLLLVLSHPFTGLQAMLIYFAWISYESLYKRNKDIPLTWTFTTGIFLLCHILYYLVYLPSFPVHQQVFSQWKLNWNLSSYSALLAFLPLLIPAVYRIYSEKTNSSDKGFTSFLVITASVSLSLMFNNIFLNGYQPLHFTRGYFWLAIFLLSWPVIREFISRCKRLKLWLRNSFIALFLIIMLSDNLSWFIFQSKKELKGSNLDISVSQKGVLDYLAQHSTNKDLLISDEGKIGYLSIVYSPVKSVYSHWSSTPDAVKKVMMLNSFKMEGKMDSSWNHQSIYYIKDSNRPIISSLSDTLANHFSVMGHFPPYVVYYTKK